MEDSVFLTLMQNTLILILIISTPILVISMVLGLLISVFQAVTQIQESTLTFVPKIIAGILTLIVLFPWMLNMFVSRCTEMFDYIQTMIK